jgi:hypothetical protein
VANFCLVCFDASGFDLLDKSASRGVGGSDDCDGVIDQVQLRMVIHSTGVDDARVSSAHPSNEVLNRRSAISIETRGQVAHNLLNKCEARALLTRVVNPDQDEYLLPLCRAAYQAPSTE